MFETTQQNVPKAAKNVKQIIIVNGMPFQIKSIFGLEETPSCQDKDHDLIKGVSEDDQS